MDARPRQCRTPAEPTQRPRCRECGDVLLSGTYGIIFASRRSPTEVIKGSIKIAGEEGTCPAYFKQEFKMAHIVYHLLEFFQSQPWYRSAKRPWSGRTFLESVRPYDWKIEAGACFFCMPRLFPVETGAELQELTPGYGRDRRGKGAIGGGS